MLNNPLFCLWLSCVKRIKPVHSLPGRLRVQIYGVRQYPELAKEYMRPLQDEIMRLPGVQSASLNVLTGNLLLTYDVRMTSEQIILERLNEAWTSLMEYFRKADRPEMVAPGAIADRLNRVWHNYLK